MLPGCWVGKEETLGAGWVEWEGHSSPQPQLSPLPPFHPCHLAGATTRSPIQTPAYKQHSNPSSMLSVGCMSLVLKALLAYNILDISLIELDHISLNELSHSERLCILPKFPLEVSIFNF